jgi:hypothetical protein
MPPNNALHPDGPRIARPAGERGRYAPMGTGVTKVCGRLNG